MLKTLSNENVDFPSIEDIEDGYIAMGGDLTPERLVAAYSRGIFPFFSFRMQPILWACPLDRFVIFPHEIHISHSMRTLLNSNKFEVSFNEEFEGVIKCCSKVDERDAELGAWLGPQMIASYCRLHEMGKAMSVEVWQDDILVGGLYGVTLNRCFFGESMFSLVPSASKAALIALAQTLSQNGWKMIDCQYETEHLKSMGGRHISYEEYMQMVESE